MTHPFISRRLTWKVTFPAIFVVEAVMVMVLPFEMELEKEISIVVEPLTTVTLRVAEVALA